ncbi:MAG TPA: 5-oxoprolinase subunit PxpA, partial [Burkholderiales bacterium]|nr:5-oxoprolinase subunit PxpA [Burkholderiales bacterium]
MKRIDLNCDMGESYGAWHMGADAEVMPHISSANIACGFHGGDPATIRKTVRLALDHGVAIGAHPSLQDLQGFGRRVMKISPQEMYDLVVYTAGAVDAFARAAGSRLHHIKCHGALYNMAAIDAGLSEALVRAAKD